MNENYNVILLTVDCLRADHLGCLGYSKETSPYIDNLAKRGVLFTQGISNGGDTYSSFPSILTSSYSRVHFPEDKMPSPGDGIYLSETRDSIAEILKRYGYKTAAFHSNPWISAFYHYDKGFDTFYDAIDRSFTRKHRISPRAITKIINDSRAGRVLYNVYELVRMLQGQQSTKVRASMINNNAISWLKDDPDNFFVWLHYMDAHAPYVPLDSSISQRINSWILLKWKDPKVCSDKERTRRRDTLIDFYDREIKYIDREVGVFLNRISKMGISSDNTYFILTADHGEQLNDHGIFGHGIIGQGHLYDDVIHVPLIIAGPNIPENIIIQEQVSLLDLGPLILDLLNIPKPKNFQGTSIRPLIEGKTTQKKGVISEGSPFKYQGIVASRISFRTEKWKYILLFDDDYQQIDAELFNIQDDPYEQVNIIKSEREIAKEFKQRLLDHIAIQNRERRRTFSEMPREYDEEERKQIMARLRKLGYIG